MDSQTAMVDLHNYPALLRVVCRSETLTGKSRRHVLTFADTWAPGEPRATGLPVECAAGKWRAFRLAMGPIPAAGRVVAHLGIEDASEVMIKDCDFRVNGEACRLIGSVDLEKPKPDSSVFGFEVPRAVLNRGYNLLEICPKSSCRIVWVETAIKS
jgi:hypothetical protein